MEAADVVCPMLCMEFFLATLQPCLCQSHISRRVHECAQPTLANSLLFDRIANLERAFAYAAPSTWNNLTIMVKVSPTICDFKLAHNTYLFRVDYSI